MNHLINYWRQSYYCDFFSCLFAIVGFITSLRKAKIFQSLKSMSILFGSYILLSLIYFTGAVFIKSREYHPIFLALGFYSDLIYTIVELIIFSLLIKNAINHNKTKKQIQVLIFLFVSTAAL